jgi:hypothetical protein
LRHDFFLRFGVWRSGLLQQPAATLFLQPITVAADRDDVAVAQQTIKDAVATTGSLKTEPRSPTLRLLVSRITPLS